MLCSELDGVCARRTHESGECNQALDVPECEDAPECVERVELYVGRKMFRCGEIE